MGWELGLCCLGGCSNEARPCQRAEWDLAWCQDEKKDKGTPLTIQQVLVYGFKEFPGNVR